MVMLSVTLRLKLLSIKIDQIVKKGNPREFEFKYFSYQIKDKILNKKLTFSFRHFSQNPYVNSKPPLSPPNFDPPEDFQN